METGSTAKQGGLKILRRWAWRLALGGVGLVLLVGLSGVLYQALSSAYDARRFPPPGKLIDIGGYKLHLNETGEGAPTVVLDAGMGDSCLYWHLVQSDVSKVARVCSYDRAGLGWSDLSPLPRTSRNIAQELHTLLTKAGIPGPYILVGHSFGGLTVRAFAQQYPDEVAGLVLVDSVHEDYVKSMPESMRRPFLNYPYQLAFMKNWAPLGLPRLLYVKLYPELPPELQPIDLALRSRTSYMKARYDDEVSFQKDSAGMKAGEPIPQAPLIVLTASDRGTLWENTSPEDFQRWKDQWFEHQNALAALSANSLHVTVDSTHLIPLERPDAVSKAILEVVAAVREQRPMKAYGE